MKIDALIILLFLTLQIMAINANINKGSWVSQPCGALLGFNVSCAVEMQDAKTGQNYTTPVDNLTTMGIFMSTAQRLILFGSVPDLGYLKHHPLATLNIFDYAPQQHPKRSKKFPSCGLPWSNWTYTFLIEGRLFVLPTSSAIDGTINYWFEVFPQPSEDISQPCKLSEAHTAPGGRLLIFISCTTCCSNTEFWCSSYGDRNAAIRITVDPQTKKLSFLRVALPSAGRFWDSLATIDARDGNVYWVTNNSNTLWRGIPTNQSDKLDWINQKQFEYNIPDSFTTDSQSNSFHSTLIWRWGWNSCYTLRDSKLIWRGPYLRSAFTTGSQNFVGYDDTCR